MIDVAYAAGFFDGEGYVSIVRRKPGYPGARPQHRVDVEVSNRNPDPLRLMKERWGGRLEHRERETLSGSSTDIWKWKLTGRSAKGFLTAIRPYLIVKTMQVEIALALQDRLDRGRRTRVSLAEWEAREEMRRACTELKEAPR